MFSCSFTEATTTIEIIMVMIKLIRIMISQSLTLEDNNLWDQSYCTEQCFKAFYDGNLWEIYCIKKSPLWRACCFVKKSWRNEIIRGRNIYH